jgi:hypothetical protein
MLFAPAWHWAPLQRDQQDQGQFDDSVSQPLAGWKLEFQLLLPDH